MTHATLQQPPNEPPSEFVPVEGGRDTTSAEALLVIAYIAMWLLFFGFAILTHRRQRGLNQKLDQLEAALKRADTANAADSS
jgi:CcmD family protein